MSESSASLLRKAIRSIVDDKIDQINTSFPATIIEYENQIATVQPNIRHVFYDGDDALPPVITDVPVILPSGGGGILSFPIRAGDAVWINCSMVALDEWVEGYSEDLTPTTIRRHSLTDAVAIPCIYSKNIRIGVDPDNVELKFTAPPEEDGGELQLLSSIKLLNNKNIEIVSEAGNSVKLLEDKSIEVVSESGSSVKMLSDGNIEITTAATIKIQNESEELVNLVSELMGLLGDIGTTTTNTMLGPSPLNSAPQINALKTRLDTLKG